MHPFALGDLMRPAKQTEIENKSVQNPCSRYPHRRRSAPLLVGRSGLMYGMAPGDCFCDGTAFTLRPMAPSK